MPSLLLELRNRVGPALRVGSDAEAQGDSDESPCASSTSGTRFRLRRAALGADGPEELLQRLAVAEGGGPEQAVGAQQLGERGVDRGEKATCSCMIQPGSAI
jgi:hypothetical protein